METITEGILTGCEACLFDLDGVLTPTADVHQQAWARLFTTFLADHPGTLPYCDQDYYRLIDGRPRYDAVSAFLASRGLSLPWGEPTQPGSLETICALGNLKDSYFLAEVHHNGVRAYPDSVEFLTSLTTGHLPMAVVSASQNARTVLESAGILDIFAVIVDGQVTHDLGLKGKPAPDTYLEAARLLGVAPGACAVFEDAIGGVQAGRAGGFRVVVGVDRGAGRQALLDNGATVVVTGLGQVNG